LAEPNISSLRGGANLKEMSRFPLRTAATVDRRRYPDARLPDVLVDGPGGRCKSKARTSALGESPLNLFSEVVATLIEVRFYGMSALPPRTDIVS